MMIRDKRPGGSSSARFRSIVSLCLFALVVTSAAWAIAGQDSSSSATLDLHSPPDGYTIYVAPHSHIDLVWYWTYDKTQVISINILRHALDLLKRDPRYAFTQDQKLALQPFWDSLSEPDRAFLRKMIQDGRFEDA